MIKLFTTNNGTKVIVDTDLNAAFTAVYLTPQEHAKLISLPYSASALNDWNEEELDTFALSPISNVLALSIDSMERAACSYLINKINAQIIS